VTFSLRLDEGLRLRLEERAVVEGRSLANMLERLLELGLGQVVTERDHAGQQMAAGDLGTRSEADKTVVHPVSSRSVTSCPNERFHRSGVFCKGCGRVA
jgi:hypothetical protein